MQSNHRCEGSRQRGDLVGERYRGQERLTAGFTRYRGQSGQSLCLCGEPGTIGIGPVLAETGDPRDDETWVVLQEHLRSHSEPLESPGTEVLHQHIRSRAELAHRGQVTRILEIETDTTLVATQQLPPHRLTVVGIAPAHRPRRVPIAGPFDLDDIGPEITQVAGCSRSGNHRRHVDHPQIAERSGWSVIHRAIVARPERQVQRTPRGHLLFNA